AGVFARGAGVFAGVARRLPGEPLRLCADGYVAALGAGADGILGAAVTGTVKWRGRFYHAETPPPLKTDPPPLLWCNLFPRSLHARRFARLRYPDRAAFLLPQPLSHRTVGGDEVPARQHRADQPPSAIPGIAAPRPARDGPRPSGAGVGAPLDDGGARRCAG